MSGIVACMYELYEWTSWRMLVCSAVAATLCVVQTVVEADNVDIVIVKRWKEYYEIPYSGFFLPG